MGISTKIEWCDSTVNAQMGCDGCELWNRKTGEGTCYAATLTERYGGRNGWPASFGEPKIFPERIAKACDWPDLAGTERPDKAWLDGYPRLNFLDDMGDTFTESLPLDWLAPHIPAMAAAPCIWMMLTKRARRMRRFWEAYGPVPSNFWLMTSVTGAATAGRVAELAAIPDAARLVSYEPMLEWLDLPLTGIDGVIFGGESGPDARPTPIEWIRRGVAECRAAGASPFVKQLGALPLYDAQPGDHGTRVRAVDGHLCLSLSDPKGGDWSEWSPDLRVRELPDPAGALRGRSGSLWLE